MKNNTMKKLLTAALSLSLALSLAACSGGTPSETQIPAAETTPARWKRPPAPTATTW